LNLSRKQGPILPLQPHAVYSIWSNPWRWWASVGAAYDWGGRSAVNGVTKDDYREDLLLRIQICYVANRAQAQVGSDLDNLAVALSMQF